MMMMMMMMMMIMITLMMMIVMMIIFVDVVVSVNDVSACHYIITNQRFSFLIETLLIKLKHRLSLPGV